MPIRVMVGTPQQAAILAGRHFAGEIARVIPHRKYVWGVSTGSSPLETYGWMIAEVEAGRLSFDQVVTAGLDEYVDIDPAHPERYENVLRRTLWDPAQVPLAHRLLPDPKNPADYDRRIRSLDGGGVDGWLLGIGRTGHLGFNEPKSKRNSRTRIVKLLPQTRQDNARFFGGDLEAVPHKAVTAGLRLILATHDLVLLAFGDAKADAVYAMLEGPVGEHCPASFLQEHTGNVLVLVDQPASVKLKKTPIIRIAA